MKKANKITESDISRWYAEGKVIGQVEQTFHDEDDELILFAGHMTYIDVNYPEEVRPFFAVVEEEGIMTARGVDCANPIMTINDEETTLYQYHEYANSLAGYVAFLMYQQDTVADIPEFMAGLVATYKGDDSDIKRLQDAGYCKDKKTREMLKGMVLNVMKFFTNHWDILIENIKLARAFFDADSKENVKYLIEVLENGDDKTVAKILEGSLDKRERNDMLKMFKSHLENMRD